MIFSYDLRQSSIKALSKLHVTILFVSFATTTFRSVSEKVRAKHIFKPICMIFTKHIQQTSDNNCVKVQLKIPKRSRAMLFFCACTHQKAAKATSELLTPSLPRKMFTFVGVFTKL
jgi:hypothetical protein